eukprot:CAMPEP_0184869810 /NCGR_PEP_ID=MMETSP0580-20130426/35392_1 /TAXON_ID=1118495 /ORGANISM="Dactyliosolen fragilissimus" /LENGTH=180 /DNA_ID=CAMNT_0027371541 /DNA_START=24 /DNA_END=566 /DNA_ORIENTATION=-
MTWYVDDTKVSHVKKEVVTKVLNETGNFFGDLKITQGKRHNLLGMDIIINNDKTISIDMSKYLEEIWDEYKYDLKSIETTPVKIDLFEIDPDSPLLVDYNADIFHSTTAKLLWVSKCGRPDLELKVSFLCTRVKASTVEDKTKVERLLSFVKGTIKDMRRISIKHIGELVSMVYAITGIH